MKTRFDAEEAGTLERREQFNKLVSDWKYETGNASVLRFRYAHQSYQKILAFGPVAIQWILEELRDEPDWWFEALVALTRQNPTDSNDSFAASVNSWLKWGRSNGYNV